MDKGQSFFRSIRFRLTVIICFGAVMLILLFIGIIANDHRSEQRLFKNRLASKESIFNLTTKNTSTQLYTFAYDYTYWDEMVSFISGGGKDLAFAQGNIDTGLGTYGANCVWVYDKSGKLVYTTNNLEGFDPQKSQPLSLSQLKVVFRQNGVYTFYSQLPQGVFEIDAASVHPTNDPERKTPAAGYYIVGKILKGDYIKGVEQATEGKASILHSGDLRSAVTAGYDIEPGRIWLGKLLKDYRGQPIAALRVDYTAVDLRDTLSVQDDYLVSEIVILSAMTGVLFVFSYFWILRPMTKVQKSLATEDVKPITYLTPRPDEFGSISRLVVKSFEQQKLLTAQKEMVEKEVEDRTRQLKNEETTLRTLIDSMPVGVYMCQAPEGKPVYINEIGVQILGRELVEGTNKGNLGEIYQNIKEDGSKYPSDELPINITLATKKRVLKDDVISIRPDGSRAYLRIISAPIIYGDGSMPYVVSIFEDISHERELEKSRDEFFSIASHELRTPLTAIRGNTAMIRQYYAESLKDPELKEMVDDIHESSIRLINIVNDFLDTSRLEQHRVKYEPVMFDMPEMAREVIKEYQVTGSRQKVHIEVKASEHPLPKVWADRDRTKQVLINLVGNALKFTRAGSITISFRSEGSFLRVFVQDTGEGMDQAAKEKLFRKFEQTGKNVLTRDSVRGTGLGLYISKMIIEQMKGTIRLEHSEPGHGTTFSFTVPTGPSAEHHGDETRDNQPNQHTF